MDQLWRYPLKIWLTSVFVGPFLLLSLSNQPSLLNYVFSFDYLQFYFLAVVVGGLVSAPFFLFLWLCYTLLTRCGWRAMLIRLSLLIVSLLCCSTIFIMVSRPDLWNVSSVGAYRAIGSYFLPLFFGVSFYKLNQFERDLQVES